MKIDIHKKKIIFYLLGIFLSIIFIKIAKYFGPLIGVATLFGLTLTISSFILFIQGLLWLVFSKRLNYTTNIVLGICSLTVCFVCFEVYLTLSKHMESTVKLAIPLAIPTEWEIRHVDIPGAKRAYYWHNKLHVFNSDSMRRTKPFPPKENAIFRIMVVGDSITYGQGVAEDETYGKILEKKLAENYRVKVLNLGVCAYQSEDIKDLVKRFTVTLRPDLVIYGICLNDFLPSRTNQYNSNMAYTFPLPDRIKRFLIKRTNTGKFLEESYNKLLIKLDLRNDFFDDILKNFKNYQSRFASDLIEMNAIVLKEVGQPVIAMVLDQYPSYGGRGYKIAKLAEKYANDGSMIVVPTENYYQKYEGEKLYVSKWEGHPNKKAHKIFAEMLLPYIVDRIEDHMHSNMKKM